MIPMRFTRACLFALVLGSAVPSFAVPLVDLRAEDLVPMADDVRKMLNLNANQQTLWNQVETRAKAILRERQRRRDALQERAKALLGKPDVELRDLDQEVAAENATSQAEDQQLRAMWLEVNDALDDAQRRQVAALLGEQLMRVAPDGHAAGGERGGQHGGERGGRGMGRGRGGMGGASVNMGG
jgi:hypothetical protein